MAICGLTDHDIVSRNERPFRAQPAAMFAGAAGAAGATGTATIASPDGSTKSYANVRIAIWNESMAVTSADGKGTVVFGKASCTKVGELVRCLPWDATLFQNGNKEHIALQSGTVWLNPTSDYQSLADSSEKIAPHGRAGDVNGREPRGFIDIDIVLLVGRKSGALDGGGYRQSQADVR